MSDEMEENSPFAQWLKNYRAQQQSAQSTEPSAQPACGNCRFGVPTPQLNQLSCTRYPPAIMLMPPNQFVTQFPIMRPNQLCGEWQSKLDS